MSKQQPIDDAVAGSGKKVKLTVVVREDELDGGFIAECLDIPGCMSQGETEDEANKNLVDARTSCITVMIEDQLNKSAIMHHVPNPNEKKENFEVTTLVHAVCIG